MRDKIRLFTAFSGYDSQAMALDTTWLDYDFVGYSEIKPTAIKVHERLFPGVPNFGDISKIDWASVPDFDIFTYSFPCQDLSLMGKRKGMRPGSGTRSSLLWECAKAIEAKRPRYLISENVPQCVNPDLIPWLRFLTELGYVTTVITSDAYDHGSLQHRKRTFFLSRPEAMGFPRPLIRPRERQTWEDVIEFERLEATDVYKELMRREGKSVHSFDKVTAMVDKTTFVANGTQDGGCGTLLEGHPVKVANFVYGYIHSVAPRILHLLPGGKYCYRRLTGRESLRLQGVTEDNINKMLECVTDVQASRLAGDSINILQLSDMVVALIDGKRKASLAVTLNNMLYGVKVLFFDLTRGDKQDKRDIKAIKDIRDDEGY